MSEELEALRAEMRFNSLGDRPHGMAAAKLRRLIGLERLESEYKRIINELRARGELRAARLVQRVWLENT